MLIFVSETKFSINPVRGFVNVSIPRYSVGVKQIPHLHFKIGCSMSIECHALVRPRTRARARPGPVGATRYERVAGELHAVDPDVVWRAQLTRINTPPPEGAAFSASAPLAWYAAARRLAGPMLFGPLVGFQPIDAEL